MEIWLPYGDTEIVLDIKAENLLDNLKYESKKSEEIDIELERIDAINSHSNICLLDNNKILGDLAIRIRDKLNQKGITSTLYVPYKLRSTYKEYNPKILDASIYKKKDTILLSMASYDPVFGYGGVPVKIIRSNKEIMSDIIKDVNRPSSGKPTDALSRAYKYVEHFESRSIEVIIDNSEIVMDEPIKAHQRIIKTFPRLKSQRCKSIVIGSGNTHTLAESLRALWNCIDVLRDGSKVILLAEGSNGLGSEGLDMLVYYKRRDEYLEGMEDLKFIDWVRARYDVSLVTALPDYYIKMIGFRSFRSINHALKYIIGKNPREKITIVHDASNVLVSE